jgi:hypothetical protein
MLEDRSIRNNKYDNIQKFKKKTDNVLFEQKK